MGKGPEVPPDDRGLPEDATREAAQTDPHVDAALSIMREKFAQLESRDERISEDPNVQAADVIMREASREVDLMKSAESQLAHDIQERNELGDPRVGQFVDEAMAAVNSYGQNQISRAAYIAKLRDIDYHLTHSASIEEEPGTSE